MHVQARVDSLPQLWCQCAKSNSSVFAQCWPGLYNSSPLMQWTVAHGSCWVVAAQPPDMGKTDYTPRGWAMEARLNAEDPLRNFLPSAGTLGSVSFPLKDSGAPPRASGCARDTGVG